METLESQTNRLKIKYQKRLKLINNFIQNKCTPTWIMIKYLPVLPPNLRPIIKMQDNTIITSDLNYLYSDIININNKITKLKNLLIPTHLIFKEKILLYTTVNKLISNTNKRKYKSNLCSIF